MDMQDANQSTDQSITKQGARLSAMPVTTCLYVRSCCWIVACPMLCKYVIAGLMTSKECCKIPEV